MASAQVSANNLCLDAGFPTAIQRAPGGLGDLASRVPKIIMTPGLFSLMELPTELRLKILSELLVSTKSTIMIDSTQKGARIMDEEPKVGLERPSVAVLQTCKRINEEGTPILYGRNNITVCLSLEPKQNLSSRQSNTFFLRPMRWSTIDCINTLTFISNTPGLSQANPFERDMYGRPRALFSCTVAHLLSRLTVSDFKYSPKGPDEYVALSMSNYVSTQVMKAELSAFQRELELMMRPSEEYAAAIADDPAT